MTIAWGHAPPPAPMPAIIAQGFVQYMNRLCQPRAGPCDHQHDHSMHPISGLQILDWARATRRCVRSLVHGAHEQPHGAHRDLGTALPRRCCGYTWPGKRQWRHSCCQGVTRGHIVMGCSRGSHAVIMIIIISARRPRTAHHAIRMTCFSQNSEGDVCRFLNGAIWQHWCCWGLAPLVHGPWPSHGAERALHCKRDEIYSKITKKKFIFFEPLTV